MINDPETLNKLAEKKLAPIPFDQAQALADTLGASGCYYSSALTQKGLKEAMNGVLRAATHNSPAKSSKKSTKCILQ